MCLEFVKFCSHLVTEPTGREGKREWAHFPNAKPKYRILLDTFRQLFCCQLVNYTLQVLQSDFFIGDLG